MGEPKKGQSPRRRRTQSGCSSRDREKGFDPLPPTARWANRKRVKALGGDVRRAAARVATEKKALTPCRRPRAGRTERGSKPSRLPLRRDAAALDEGGVRHRHQPLQERL